jgi:hypothetical protein
MSPVALGGTIGLASGRAKTSHLSPPLALAAVAAPAGLSVSWQVPPEDAHSSGFLVAALPLAGGTPAFVFAGCSQCHRAFISDLAPAHPYKVAVAAVGTGKTVSRTAIGPTVTTAALASAGVTAPQSVSATINDQTATVTWTPPTADAGVVGYQVQAVDSSYGTTYVNYTCSTCLSTSFANLGAGHSYYFDVLAEGPGGDGPVATSNAVTATDPTCPATSLCAAIGSPGPAPSPAKPVAQGFLGDLTPTANAVAKLLKLGVSSLRLASPHGSTSPPAPVTVIVSDAWYQATYSPRMGGALPPWECWKCYKGFVSGLVKRVMAAHDKVSYWDIQNEPGNGYFGPHQEPNQSLEDQQFALAAQTIRSVDPQAKLIGPSAAGFAAYPNPSVPSEPDLYTFLEAATRAHLPLAALSFHANSPDQQPEVLAGEVAATRALAARFLHTFDPSIFVNEYGPKTSWSVPGWEVGWLAALETTGVAQADRACWSATGSDGQKYSTCANNGTLDGLLTLSGQDPTALYRVAQFYGEMTGRTSELLPAATSTPTLSVLATATDAGGGGPEVMAMVGRHDTCTAAANPDCDQPASLTPPARPLVLTMAVSGQEHVAQVRLAFVPDQPGAVSLAWQQADLPVTAGRITIPIPSLSDGEALLVTVQPISGPGG